MKGLINKGKPSKVISSQKRFTEEVTMLINQPYHTWIRRMKQLRPHERITRIRNLVWLMLGMYQSRSVHLSKIASEMPGNASIPSLTRRLSRFVTNAKVKVSDWYGPLARQWMSWQAQTTGEVRLIIDGTRAGFGGHLLMVALAYRRRAIPIAWTWVVHAHGRGRTKTSSHLTLLHRVHRWVPPGVQVLVVGDTEFGDVPLLRQLEAWGWHYALRQRATIQVKLPGTQVWKNMRDLIDRPGQSLWVKEAFLTLKHIHVANLYLTWKAGEPDPWLIVTDLSDAHITAQAYRRRMWIEEMFGDFKAHGVDLEETHLRSPAKLSRLTLAAALLYVWCISTGHRVIKQGLRPCVDRADRRDLSIFQIGLRFIKHRMANDLSMDIRLCPV